MTDITLTYASNRIGHASIMMRAGQAEGMIPADRDPLTDDHRVIYASVPHQAIGCAVFFQPEDCDFLWLDILFVAPDHRRQGIATRLLRAAEERARAAGLAELRFGTMRGNGAMINFAHALGYGREDRIDFVKAVV